MDYGKTVYRASQSVYPEKKRDREPNSLDYLETTPVMRPEYI
jgi:hypothetical protein